MHFQKCPNPNNNLRQVPMEEDAIQIRDTTLRTVPEYKCIEKGSGEIDKLKQELISTSELVGKYYKQLTLKYRIIQVQKVRIQNIRKKLQTQIAIIGILKVSKVLRKKESTSHSKLQKFELYELRSGF